jgi:hypothetical protein
MVILPVLWTIGILPQIDVLFLWIAEQGVIFLCGGSAAASDVRLIVSLIISVLEIIFVPSIMTTLC